MPLFEWAFFQLKTSRNYGTRSQTQEQNWELKVPVVHCCLLFHCLWRSVNIWQVTPMMICLKCDLFPHSSCTIRENYPTTSDVSWLELSYRNVFVLPMYYITMTFCHMINVIDELPGQDRDVHGLLNWSVIGFTRKCILKFVMLNYVVYGLLQWSSSLS